MQIVRTIVWIVLLMAFVALTVLNWTTELAVFIWPGIVWDTRLPAVIVVAFLLGLVPMWLIHRGAKWRLQRRIAGLETAARNAALAQPPVPATNTEPPNRAETLAEPSPPSPAAEPVPGAPVPKDDILR